MGHLTLGAPLVLSFQSSPAKFSQSNIIRRTQIAAMGAGEWVSKRRSWCSTLQAMRASLLASAIASLNRFMRAFPAHMVKSLLEQDGLSDAGLVHKAESTRLAKLFGCDAVLYISIEKWESQYAVFATSTNVDFNYRLKSCKTGETLWENRQALSYSPQQNNSSGNPLAALLAAAVIAAMEKAAPNYMPLAQQANMQAAGTAGFGLPAGPYLSSAYLKDLETYPANSGAGVSK